MKNAILDQMCQQVSDSEPETQYNTEFMTLSVWKLFKDYQYNQTEFYSGNTTIRLDTQVVVDDIFANNIQQKIVCVETTFY